MNEITNLPNDDGMSGYDDDDRSSNSIIRGMKLKFDNGVWTTRDDVVIAGEHEFVVVRIIMAVQRWIDERPADGSRVLAPYEDFPDTDKLNAEAPREEWREKFGKEVGPWENTWAVYLIDKKTFLAYTYPTPTNTVGGDRAVRELRGSVSLARRFHGENLFARVRLSSTPMRTQYGGRQRPFFDIIGYETGSERAPLTAVEPKQIEAKPVDAKPVEAKPAAAPQQNGADPAAKPVEAPQQNGANQAAAKPAKEAEPKPKSVGKGGKGTAQRVRF